jgi:LmbE family N-acetylglucosaminyl deacetylase
MARTSLEKAVGLARWLGLLGGRAQLDSDIVVVSPHLDDAVFSLGAAVSRTVRTGTEATILTVLAGDPSSSAPAGEWDRQAGFQTAGEAARVRRDEDTLACGLLGARSHWLPFSDMQYERGGSDDEIRARVVDAAGSAFVLLPGFPLVHDDHHWLKALLEDAFEPERVGFYAEQPYAAFAERRPGGWIPLAAGLHDRWRKIAACRAYASQLSLFGGLVGNVTRYEMQTGGEAAAWKTRM